MGYDRSKNLELYTPTSNPRYCEGQFRSFWIIDEVLGNNMIWQMCFLCQSKSRRGNYAYQI